MMIAELMVVELFIITLVAGMPDLTYKRELKQSTEHANLLNESVMDASDDTEARADLTPALAESPYQTSPLGVFQLGQFYYPFISTILLNSLFSCQTWHFQNATHADLL
jgi:hypothetical protein